MIRFSVEIVFPVPSRAVLLAAVAIFIEPDAPRHSLCRLKISYCRNFVAIPLFLFLLQRIKREPVEQSSLWGSRGDIACACLLICTIGAMIVSLFTGMQPAGITVSL